MLLMIEKQHWPFTGYHEESKIGWKPSKYAVR
jgi:hypothetical protein